MEHGQDGRATHVAHPPGQPLLPLRWPGGVRCLSQMHDAQRRARRSPPGAPFVVCAPRLGCAAMRYADPFREAGRPETTDHDFLLTCSCGMEQRLDEMGLDETGPITLYECKRCTKSIVGVMTDDPDLKLHAPPGAHALGGEGRTPPARLHHRRARRRRAAPRGRGGRHAADSRDAVLLRPVPQPVARPVSRICVAPHSRGVRCAVRFSRGAETSRPRVFTVEAYRRRPRLTADFPSTKGSTMPITISARPRSTPRKRTAVVVGAASVALSLGASAAAWLTATRCGWGTVVPRASALSAPRRRFWRRTRIAIWSTRSSSTTPHVRRCASMSWRYAIRSPREC